MQVPIDGGPQQDHKCFCIESCFACSVCQSPLRGLPQDVAVPSRCRRRESPETIQILKIAVSYDFSRINMTKRSRFKLGRQRIY